MNWISNIKIDLITDSRSCIKEDKLIKFDLFRYHRQSRKNVKIFSIHLSVNVCFNYLHPLTSNLLRKIIKFSMRRGISIEVSPALRSYIFIIKNEVRECRGNCHLAKLFDTIYKMSYQRILEISTPFL